MNQPDSMTLLGTLDKKRSDTEPLANFFSRFAQVILLCVVVLSPWAFGSVYYWAQALIGLGLLIALAIWWFETAVNSDKSQQLPYISFVVICGLGVALFQLVPLPDFLTSIFLGRQAEIYREFTGEPATPGRISLFPQGTWHQFQLLLMALAALLLTSRYFRTAREIIILMAVIAANGCLLGTLGMLQRLSSDRIFWIFEYAQSPFASFVNRNNAAGYLLMTLACCIGLLPIVMPVRVTSGPPGLISREMPYWRQLSQYLSYFLAELNASKIILLTGTILIASSIIASASRGASIALLVGVVVTFLTYGLARRPQNMSIVLLPLILLVVALSVWVGFSDKLLQRWQGTDLVELSQMDARIRHWQDTWQATKEMGPLGAGLGSYLHVHRLYRQSYESVVFRYAENQYFQALVEAGWPGLLIFLAAWVFAFRYAMLLILRGQSNTTVGVGAMGIFLLSSQAAASLFDFGFYVPSNMILMATLVGMLGYQAHAFSARLKKAHWLRHRFSNRLIQFGLLFIFGGLTVSTLDLYRHSKIDTLIRHDEQFTRRLNQDWDFQRLGMSQTTRRIEELTQMLSHCNSLDGWNHLGDLWIHRFRLMSLAVMEKTAEYLDTMALAVDEKEKEKLREDAWGLTRLERTRDYIQDLGYNFSQLRAIAVTKEPFISENIPPAYRSFATSRANAPLQPVVHLKLGQLGGILNYAPGKPQGGKEVEHAILLAPSNAQYRLLGAIFFLQERNVDAAAPHIRRFLELVPDLTMPMDVLYARTPFNSFAVPPQVVFDQMLPENPVLIFSFAKNWCKTDPETRNRALEKIEELLVKSDIGELNKLKLRADVYLEKGEITSAIETMATILRGNPLDENVRFQRASLLLNEKRLPEALEEARNLIRSNRMNASYNRLLNQIESEIQKLDRSQLR
jgi:O-antigen ligase/tetratricopeptide (TPR) repeat protein